MSNYVCKPYKTRDGKTHNQYDHQLIDQRQKTITATTKTTTTTTTTTVPLDTNPQVRD